jgi:histone H3/H4
MNEREPRIPLSLIRRIARRYGVERVSREALETMRDLTEAYLALLSSESSKIAEHAKRRTIMKEDVELAFERL